MSVQPRGIVAHPVGSVMPGLVKLRVSVIWNCFVPHCHSPHTATGGGASVTPCLSVCSGGGILSGVLRRTWLELPPLPPPGGVDSGAPLGSFARRSCVKCVLQYKLPFVPAHLVAG